MMCLFLFIIAGEAALNLNNNPQQPQQQQPDPPPQQQQQTASNAVPNRDLMSGSMTESEMMMHLGSDGDGGRGRGMASNGAATPTSKQQRPGSAARNAVARRSEYKSFFSVYSRFLFVGQLHKQQKLSHSVFIGN